MIRNTERLGDASTEISKTRAFSVECCSRPRALRSKQERERQIQTVARYD
jgi:hypothetical protein